MTCEAELCNEEKENFDDMVQQGVSVIFLKSKQQD